MTEKRIRSRSLNPEAMSPNNQFQGTSPLRGGSAPRWARGGMVYVLEERLLA